jgi:subtilisin family serine protease
MAENEVTLPAWSLERDVARSEALSAVWPLEDARDWAWGGSRGAGVSVCVVDSGIDSSHPLVGAVEGSFGVIEAEETLEVAADSAGDLFGHGTACAGIIRSVAPDCALYSVRVLGGELTGTGDVLLRGLRWAIDQRFDLINLSLSTTKQHVAAQLRELADLAYFRNVSIVASAHNMPVESYPWRFSSVLSVGSHDGRDPYEYYANSSPPVEFVARGVDLELAWTEGSTIVATGNSFAAPHITGIAALILAKHPGLRPYELKAVLRAACSNGMAAASGPDATLVGKGP